MSQHVAQVIEGLCGPFGSVFDLVVKDILPRQRLQRDALLTAHEVLIRFCDGVLAHSPEVDLTGLNGLAKCLGLVDEDVAGLPRFRLAVLGDSDKWRALDLDLLNEHLLILHAHPLQGRDVDEHACLPLLGPRFRGVDWFEGVALALECAQVDVLLNINRVFNACADVCLALFIDVFARDELTCGKAAVFADVGYPCAQIFAPRVCGAKTFGQGGPWICLDHFDGLLGLLNRGLLGCCFLDGCFDGLGLFATQEHHNHQYRGEFHV